MIPSLELWPTKVKEAPSPHKVVTSCETLSLIFANIVKIRSFFWSVFSHIWTEYGDLLRPNTGSLLNCMLLRANNVLTYQRAMCAYVPRANMPCALAHVLVCFCAHVLMLLFSVSLPLLLKLYPLLVRFKRLITVFPQYREFIYKPSLLIICRLEKREYR